MKRIKTYRIKNKEEAQLMANFLYHERYRHVIDCVKIDKDLKEIDRKFGVKPDALIDWIEI